jgi:hypothetical protein
MDPDSAEYARATEALGSDEPGRMQLMAASNQRQVATALQGRGRRGGRQQAETLFGRLTGGTLNEMNFSVERGGQSRQLRGRNVAGQLMQILQGGNEGDRERVLGQLQQQLTSRGVSGAGSLVRDITGMARDGISEDESHQIARRLGNNTDLQRVQREAVQERQRAQNPLDATRNDILTQIRDGIVRMSEREGGQPQGEPA